MNRGEPVNAARREQPTRAVKLDRSHPRTKAAEVVLFTSIFDRVTSRNFRQFLAFVPEAVTADRIHTRGSSLRVAPAAAREDLASWLNGVSRPGALLISVGLMACVAVGDDLTGTEVSFTLLYLGPIAFATWFAGSGYGVFLSFASAFAAVVCDASTRVVALPAAIQAWNLSVQFGVFVSLAFLLGALKARLEGEQQLARTDPLTALFNRRAFLESAEIEVERARRTAQPLTVAYVDCDDFKRVNDLLGHAEGDQLLAMVAATLRGETRAADVVARLGGDEFGLLLVDTDGPTAEALLQRLRLALLQVMREHGWKVTFSIGAVTFLIAPFSAEDMISRADQLMYSTKRRGKNGLSHEVIGGRSSSRPVVSAQQASA
jgi:diguanylate cyclase (GGDEF)-like protein